MKSKLRKKVVWFCSLPAKVRAEAFADLNLPKGRDFSWIIGHLPPPEHIDLHIVCAYRCLEKDVSREWCGATFDLVKVPRGGFYLMYEGWIPALVRKARELKPDIIHGWGTECAYGLAALRASPKNHVIGIQGILLAFFPYLEKSLSRILCTLNEYRVLRKAKRCVAEGEYAKNEVSRYTRAPVSFVPHPLREEFQKSELGPRDEKTIIFLGTYYRRKGFFDAIKAFMSFPSDWKLVCIGSSPPKKEREEVDKLVKACGDRVVLTGGSLTCAEIIEWFHRSPVFLLPSYADTGPTALKEALSMGLWPVCYDNTGPQELINRYGVGTLVKTGDVEGLAETLQHVLDDQPWHDAERMERAAEKIRADLSPSVAWEKLEKVYDGMDRN